MTDVAPGRPMADLLADFSLTREDVEGVVRAGLEEASTQRFAPMTTGELEILDEGLGLGPEGVEVLHAEIERGAGVVAAEDETLERARMLGESVSMKQAAELLGKSLSAVSRGVSEGRLVAFRVDGRMLRYPLWQFNEGRPLPGLAHVVAALPHAWRPRKVLAVMTAPAEWLDGLSPRQWLAEAGDPQPVVQLLEDLDRGW